LISFAENGSGRSCTPRSTGGVESVSEERVDENGLARIAIGGGGFKSTRIGRPVERVNGASDPKGSRQV